MRAPPRSRPWWVLGLVVGALGATRAWRTPPTRGAEVPGLPSPEGASEALRWTVRDQALIRAEPTVGFLRHLLSSPSSAGDHR